MDRSFGQRIRELRLAAGFSQEQLAEELHVSRQAVSKWENGDSAPDLERLSLLGSLFHISLDQLVRGAPPEDGQTAPLDFEKLAAQNRLLRKRQFLLTIGWTGCALAAASAAVLCALRRTASATAYLLYRYIATGEFAYAPADCRLSLLLAAALFAAGGGCLLLAGRLRK